MEKKQSSIEWLEWQINLGLSERGLISAFKEAKAMHKKEIMDAWRNGLINRLPEEYYNESFQYYYNETFGGYTGVIGVDNISWTNTNKLNNGGNNE